MLKKSLIIEAENKACAFLAAATEWKERFDVNPHIVNTGCVESGALKRASLDLTRALAKMRRGH